MFPDVLDYLRDLKANNTRDWFQAHRDRYEAEVKQPALAFVEAATPRLEEITPHFVGSLFRIHRDVRFSHDKSPYKTTVGIHFRHEDGKDAHCPGYYVHLEPGESFVAAGIWMPDKTALEKIRTSIQGRPQKWQEASRGLELGGESLKKPPRGFDADHPCVEDLKRKSFITSTRIADGTLARPAFLDETLAFMGKVTPLMRFLCDSLAVRF